MNDMFSMCVSRGVSGAWASSRLNRTIHSTPGPWMLGGDDPSLVDLQYISHVERMLASVAYWKGIAIREEGRFPNLEKWLQASWHASSLHAAHQW